MVSINDFLLSNFLTQHCSCESDIDGLELSILFIVRFFANRASLGSLVREEKDFFSGEGEGEASYVVILYILSSSSRSS